MRAMILAAGRGTRMLALTNATPKPLLAVAGKPLIVHHLLSLAAAGITDVVINTCYLGENIIAALGDGSQYGVRIQYSIETQLLETGGGIQNALHLLGQDPFLVISADIYTDFDFAVLPDFPQAMAHLVLVPNPVYHSSGDFSLDGSRVLPANKSGNFTYANIGVFKPDFFAGARRGAWPLGALLRQRVSEGAVSGEYYSGLWRNIGTPEELQLVNSTL